MKILPSEGLSLDDVLLVPRQSSGNSRFDGTIDLSTQLLPTVKLNIPIISANMDTITELSMAQAMNNAGGVGIIHRFLDIEEYYTQLQALKGARIACIGVGSKELDRLKAFSLLGLHGILIDVAHGDSKAVLKQIEAIKKYTPCLPVIAGNVCTARAAVDLCVAGADCIKVGVGNGQLCTTRIKTGNGVPQFTAITECAEHVHVRDKTIIADGGIKNSGDIVKCLAAGADAVMIGGLLAGVGETPGTANLDFTTGKFFKRYRGMASREFQIEKRGKATSVEGESKKVFCTGLSVQDVIDELTSGILSGMSYQGANNLNELRQNATFIKQTSAGYKESCAHGLL